MGFFSSFQTKNIPCVIQKISIKHIKLMEEKYITCLSEKRELAHKEEEESLTLLWHRGCIFTGEQGVGQF